MTLQIGSFHLPKDLQQQLTEYINYTNITLESSHSIDRELRKLRGVDRCWRAYRIHFVIEFKAKYTNRIHLDYTLYLGDKWDSHIVYNMDSDSEVSLSTWCVSLRDIIVAILSCDRVILDNWCLFGKSYFGTIKHNLIYLSSPPGSVYNNINKLADVLMSILNCVSSLSTL